MCFWNGDVNGLVEGRGESVIAWDVGALRNKKKPLSNVELNLFF